MQTQVNDPKSCIFSTKQSKRLLQNRVLHFPFRLTPNCQRPLPGGANNTNSNNQRKPQKRQCITVHTKCDSEEMSSLNRATNKY